MSLLARGPLAHRLAAAANWLTAVAAVVARPALLWLQRADCGISSPDCPYVCQ
jgi:hypothetical protein